MTADAATSPVKKVRRFIRRALCERADHHLGVALVNLECFETGFEEGLHLGVFDIRDESCLDQFNRAFRQLAAEKIVLWLRV